MTFCIAYGARPTSRLITLNPDELIAAAAAFDALKAEGTTTVAAMAQAVRAVNVMRTPAPAADCADCERSDSTCPGHLPNRKGAVL
ncbi:hypothetical protein I5H06_gp51 [Mycobacterium phage SirPhilip]|uniref:Uncharacterized protein n=1 Tax=Mycobacterium phage SirPhilip TaxID=2015824 RepID=A0A222ZKH0_9CAUD|nr:hypothetical protein I5H06_gp51 [Mycobacterium phage SirPhilip]ASR85253.1 hypothetical protein SEA_SIRPHILIP_51 [Mycobacterium phage SirPhilip]